MRAKNGGQYPYYYVEMIDTIFGREDNAIEVCSGNVNDKCKVDINPSINPDLMEDGQYLDSISNGRLNRWRSDPPYNAYTSKLMDGTALPSSIKLLKAGATALR